MKKILIVFDDAHFSVGAFEIARRLNETQPILLVGFFLPAVCYTYAPASAGEATQPSFVPLTEGEDVEIIQNSISRFERLCKENKIKYLVHKNLVDAAMPSLKIETRFADLLIIGSEMFYKNLRKVKPNAYLKYALHEAECPILVVLEKFDFPTCNILAYNGDESSVYAIKQFKNLFPELCKLNTLLLYASQKTDAEFPDISYIKEYASESFNGLELCKVDFDTRKYFATWISEKKGAILITGSYGRSEFSEIFKKSFAADVIEEHEVPVFIAHK